MKGGSRRNHEWDWIITSNIQNNSFSYDIDSIQAAAYVGARVRATDVGDDQHSAQVVLGPTGR